jgi:hypothetical protein
LSLPQGMPLQSAVRVIWVVFQWKISYGHQFIGFRARWGCWMGPPKLSRGGRFFTLEETPRLELEGELSEFTA